MPESSAWQQICRWQMMEEEAAHKEEDAIQTGAPLSTFLFSREGTRVLFVKFVRFFGECRNLNHVYLISANIPEGAGGTDGVEVDYPPRAPHPHFRQIIRESESTSGRGSRQQSPSAASTELSDEQPPQVLTPISPQQVINSLLKLARNDGV